MIQGVSLMILLCGALNIVGLVGCDRASKEYWSDRLKSADQQSRQNAARELLHEPVKTDAAIQALAEALRMENDLGVRATICSALVNNCALVRQVEPRTIEALNNLVTSGDIAIRGCALSAAGNLGEAASALVQNVIACLKHDDAGVRRQAAVALRMIRDHSSVTIDALLVCLNDNESSVRISAAEALAGLGEKYESAAPVLAGELRKESSECQDVALFALGRYGDRAGEYLPVLVSFLKNENEDVRCAAWKAIESMPATALGCIDRLEAQLRSEQGAIARKAATKCITKVKTAGGVKK